MPENRGETFESAGPYRGPDPIAEECSSPMIRDSADAVVVGGGVVGCSIAYHLARRGAAVVVLERETIGSQSTGRGAGGGRQQFSSPAKGPGQQPSFRPLPPLGAETGGRPPLPHIGDAFALA